MLYINLWSLSYSLLQEGENCWDDRVCAASSRATSAWHIRVSLVAQLNPGFKTTFYSQEPLWTSERWAREYSWGENIDCVLNLRHAQGSYRNSVGERQPCLTGLDAFLLPCTPVISPTSHATTWCLPGRALMRADRVSRKASSGWSCIRTGPACFSFFLQPSLRYFNDPHYSPAPTSHSL